jgi:peroxiredoxin
VLAISVDSKFSLRAYAEQEGYGFDLLADFWPHGAVASRYGVFDEGSGMARRGTFIIDAAGTVRYVVVNPRGQARDLSAYRDALAGLDQA